MQEGLANVCLITTSMTITKAKIERRMPKKGQVTSYFLLIIFGLKILFKCVFSYVRTVFGPDFPTLFHASFVFDFTRSDFFFIVCPFF